ncbi:Methyltransferase domain-containing protein [Paraburkholderia fungorum]|uniref:Methyltransferase domain-containing protein n=1 Tax=Paraburkholderia fungorum TaxID=134537 RepID=A0A1H0YMM1_9BURK|nr:class I SAM-dependent methyltransferase [Paraburkholderia fungorum]SDQ16373.1 Methyltransferase domain-containing protein [Paraburkholderia fungorum]
MKPQVDKESLNQIASQYHLNEQISDKQFDQHFHHLCFQWVRSMIEPGARVLEMGFGEGNVTRQLLDAGMRVDIIEGAELLVNSARELYGDTVQIHHALFAEFRPEHEYDAILATNILEHVGDPAETLASIRQWCGNDTRVVVTVPNAESIHRRLAVLMGIQPQLDTLSPRDHLVGHQRVYDMDRLTREVQEAGFRIVDQKGFLLKVLPNSMLKDMPQALIDALYAISDQLDVRLLGDMGIVLRKEG